MDLVTRLETIIESYNEESKCGFCWQFTHGRKDYTNLKTYNCECDCCVHFMLDDKWNYSKKPNNNYNSNGEEKETYSFSAFVGIQSRLDEQYYNELNSDSCDSKYRKYIEPLTECLKDSFQSDLCIDSSFITSIGISPQVNKKDQNLDGINLKVTFETIL